MAHEVPVHLYTAPSSTSKYMEENLNMLSVCRGAADVAREHCYDPATGLLRPNNFSDVAQHWVLQAVPAGLALVRDAEG